MNRNSQKLHKLIERENLFSLNNSGIYHCAAYKIRLSHENGNHQPPSTCTKANIHQ